ncbi:GntR family transcriptional regulator [Propylenella binzhouense]|uniref:FCD domain-containing protein n=1 Tax=Propylenella binzhouense TaxID=2555902 RepID=A0A964T7G1_9HYPH|nr:GntR family transcriptional regulator [Propylenella binzhouense]MYZ49946.1 FCD domain-containing protein [Propylenella binzhouense]
MTSTPSVTDAIQLRRSQSLSGIVLCELERMILSGELASGERLNEQKLAAKLGVSRGPIREAARALESAGLVTLVANQGMFVRRIGVEEAAELYDMRAVVFGFACARLARSARTDQIEALRGLVAEMEEAVAAADPSRYYRLNLRFHDTVLAFAGHKRAVQIYESLLKEAHLCRQRSLQPVASMRESNEEHRRMVEAIASGDPDLARRVAEDHHFGGRRRWQATLGGQDEEATGAAVA